MIGNIIGPNADFGDKNFGTDLRVHHCKTFHRLCSMHLSIILMAWELL